MTRWHAGAGQYKVLQQECWLSVTMEPAQQTLAALATLIAWAGVQNTAGES